MYPLISVGESWDLDSHSSLTSVVNKNWIFMLDIVNLHVLTV